MRRPRDMTAMERDEARYLKLPTDGRDMSAEAVANALEELADSVRVGRARVTSLVSDMGPYSAVELKISYRLERGWHATVDSGERQR